MGLAQSHWAQRLFVTDLEPLARIFVLGSSRFGVRVAEKVAVHP